MINSDGAVLAVSVMLETLMIFQVTFSLRDPQKPISKLSNNVSKVIKFASSWI